MSEQTDVERREFTSFCKFFNFRAIQAIVQSRLGKQIVTWSRTTSSKSDWFNLSIEELPDVQQVIRTSLNGSFPIDISSVCVYISLQTVEGRNLCLECWQIKYDADICDPSVSVKSAVYHRLGTLLRSILAVSRVVPAYRCYARRQGPETFVLCYQIVGAGPNYDLLGEDRKGHLLGSISCPYGTIEMTLNYRTRMVLGVTSDSALSDNDLKSRMKENYYDVSGTTKNLGETGLTALTPLSVPRPLAGVGALSPPSPRLSMSHQSSVPMIFPMGDEGNPTTSSHESLCNTTFSTSPGSGDFPLMSPFRRVSFQVGTPPVFGGPYNAMGTSPPFGGMADPSYYMTYPHASYQGLVQARASLGNIPHYYPEQQRETILALRRRACSETVHWPTPDIQDPYKVNPPPTSGRPSAQPINAGTVAISQQQQYNSAQALFFLGGQTPPSHSSSPKVVLSSSQDASLQTLYNKSASRASDVKYQISHRHQRLSAPGFGSAAAAAAAASFANPGGFMAAKSGSLDLSALPFAALLKLSSSYSAPCLALDPIKEVADRRSDNGNSTTSEDSNVTAVGPSTETEEASPNVQLRVHIPQMHPSTSESQLEATLKKAPRLPGSVSAACVTSAVVEKPVKLVKEGDAGSSSSSDSDGFVHVDVNRPAFQSNDYASELGQFVKDFRSAPPVLKSFVLPTLVPEIGSRDPKGASRTRTVSCSALETSPESQNVATMVNADEILSSNTAAAVLAGLLPTALEEFEKRQDEFDKFVRDLQKGSEEDD